MQILELLKQATSVVRELGTGDELLEIDDKIASGFDKVLVKDVLSMAGVVQTVQGTNRVYRLLQGGGESKSALEKIGQLLEAVPSALRKSQGRLTRKEVEAIIERHGYDRDYYGVLVSILSRLDLVTSAGRGRTGGVEPYNKAALNKELKAALAHGVDSSDATSDETDRAHEQVLYPHAEKVLTDLGFETTVLGVNRRLRGEWNTPDVIGIKLVRHQVLLGADMEVATVEAKWRLTKSGVAECASHKRLAHRSYLLTNERIDEIDQILIIDLLERGLGLICKHEDRFEVQIPARRTEVPPFELDGFLTVALSSEDQAALRQDLAKAIFTDAVATWGKRD